MWFVIAGCLLLVMKMTEFGFAADWPWWVILLPFGLAVLWWSFADSIGLTQRREMDKLDERKKSGGAGRWTRWASIGAAAIAWP